MKLDILISGAYNKECSKRFCGLFGRSKNCLNDKYEFEILDAYRSADLAIASLNSEAESLMRTWLG